MTTLVGCAHGSRVPEATQVIERLLGAVRARRPGLEVVAAYVDVQEPTPDKVVTRLAGGNGRADAVLVPILLSSGYHVRVDLARAAALATGVTVAPALGPDPRLTALLADRLGEAEGRGVKAGIRPATVLLAAAGSSDPLAVADVEATAAGLARRIDHPVSAAYLSAATPRLDDAVAAARSEHPGIPVAVASYLLAPGYFSNRVARCGADIVAEPLLSPARQIPPELVDLVLDRYAGPPA